MIRGMKRFILLASVLLLAGCKVKLDQSKVSRSSTQEVFTSAQEMSAQQTQAQEAVEALAPYEGDLKPFVVRAAASSDGGPEVIAELAFDNNPSSRWSSVFSDNQWVEAYFDRRVGVKKIDILWETARAEDFSIQLLDRHTNWIEVARQTDALGPSDTLSFLHPISALGVRIHCYRRATEWGNSICEVYVWGVTKGAPPARNLTQFQGRPTAWQLVERGNAEMLLTAAAADPRTSASLSDDQFLDLVEKRSFYYFWYETNPTNGLTRDRGRNFKSSEDANVASVAAVGFALSAYAIGAERGWVTRDEALERTRITLRTFASGSLRNVKGFFPHFVNYFSCADSSNTEISTIDTTLFLAGMITAMEYFQDPEVSQVGKKIFERVDWDWARNGNPNFVSHGVDSKGNFLKTHWGSTTEGLLIYMLALASPTYPLPGASWDAIDKHTGEYEGFAFVIEYGFQTFFPYQYPALWYDFRGRIDRSGVDYFENTTLAALAMRQFCILNASNFNGSYGSDLWGLAAADGPGDRYMIYGFPPGNPYSPIDGTVVPHAIGGSVPFLPLHSIRALRCLYDTRHEVWGKYGFADSINPNQNFVARDALGIDTGSILLSIENYRSQFVWNLFMKNEWIRQATQKIGWKTRPRSTDPDGPIDLARDHLWKLSSGDGMLSSPTLDDSRWLSVLVPDYWENAGGVFSGYDGMAWYRVEFDLEPARLANWTQSGRPIVFTLGAVDDTDAAFVNGFKIGETTTEPGVAQQTRRYMVSQTYLRPGRNVIAIQVTDNKDSGGIWRTPVELGPKW
jgi:hypothetical protein